MLESYRIYSCFLEQKKHKGCSVCYDYRRIYDTHQRIFSCLKPLFQKVGFLTFPFTKPQTALSWQLSFLTKTNCKTIYNERPCRFSCLYCMWLACGNSIPERIRAFVSFSCTVPGFYEDPTENRCTSLSRERKSYAITMTEINPARAEFNQNRKT